MNKEPLIKFRHIEETHKRWKQGQVTQEEFRDTVQSCRDEAVKVNQDLNLARGKKGSKKSFCRYINSKRKSGENANLLLSGAGDLVANNIEKTEVFSVFFGSAFTGKIHPQQSKGPVTTGKVWSKVDLPLV